MFASARSPYALTSARSQYNPRHSLLEHTRSPCPPDTCTSTYVLIERENIFLPVFTSKLLSPTSIPRGNNSIYNLFESLILLAEMPHPICRQRMSLSKMGGEFQWTKRTKRNNRSQTNKQFFGEVQTFPILKKDLLLTKPQFLPRRIRRIPHGHNAGRHQI